MSIEVELKKISTKLEEHEKRHDRELENLCKKQASCSQKFEKIFDALGDGVMADAEHKTRLNGFAQREEGQDNNIKDLREEVKGVRDRMDKWFIGIIFAAAVGGIVRWIFF